MAKLINNNDKMGLPGVSQPFWNLEQYGARGIRKSTRTEEFEKNIARIRQYMNQRNLPAWYRGLSKFQYDAAEELLFALRDDNYQMSTHRTEWCLKRLGLTPMVNSSQIWFLIQLSQESDLAFIWFLMEMHYKSGRADRDHNDYYTLNEQILLTCISHLDMVTILRALHEILPPPQPPKHILEQRRLREMMRQKKLEKKDQKQKKACKYMMPYFCKQPYPVQKETNFTCRPHDHKIKLGMYDSWHNSSQVIHNESKRWFAQYKLGNQNGKFYAVESPSPMNTLLEAFETANVPPDAIHEMKVQSKEIDKLEESLHSQLNTIVQEIYCNFITKQHKFFAGRQRIQKQLESDIKVHLKKFHEEALQSSKECLSKTLQYNAILSQYENEIRQCIVEVKSRISETLEMHVTNPKIANTSFSTNKVNGRQSGGAVQDERQQLNKTSSSTYSISKHLNREDDFTEVPEEKSCNTSLLKYNESTKSDKDRESQDTLPNINSALLDFRDKHISQEFVTKCESETFFKAINNTQMPYKFDYRKIFFLKKNTEENIFIRQALIKAIDSDITMLNQLCEESDPIIAINYYIEKQYQNITENHMKKQDKGNVLGYNLEYYDPDDDDLMDAMLKKAFIYLAKDPKYIAPALPLIHYHPILYEFIRVRYDKRYSTKDRRSSWEECWRVFQALYQLDLSVSFPWKKRKFALKSSTFSTDYSKRDCLFKLQNTYQRQFFRNIDTAVLSRARLYWFSMRPLLCSPSISAAFFSYIPGAPGRIPYFRPYMAKLK